MLTGRYKKLPLSGELANAVSLRGFSPSFGESGLTQSGKTKGTARYPKSSRTKKKDQRTRKSSLVFLLFS